MVGVGLAEGLGVGLVDGGLGLFVDPEHPLMARLTPAASTSAAGRTTALVGFTISGYRVTVWLGPAATRSTGDRYQMVMDSPRRKVSGVGERQNARDAGEFGSWLEGFRSALRDGAAMDVPCDGCTACCRSGKLIPVEPDEADALAHIDAGCLVPMPGEPSRHVLKHAQSGRCSQLTEDGCAVYAHRPRACRAYDCRIFPAAGVVPDSPLITERASQWQFSYASSDSRDRHDAVRMAAVVLGFPGGLSGPASPTQHALDAIDGAEGLQ